MEVIRTKSFYIFVKDEHSLWWDRVTGSLSPKTAWDLTEADNPECLGICEGIIGKVYYSTLFEQRLLLIKDCIDVGKIHGDNVVYKIKSVVFLPLQNDDIHLNLRACTKHSHYGKQSNNVLGNSQKNNTLTKTWGSLKNAGNTIKNTTSHHAAALATKLPKTKIIKDKERFEKQIIDEFYKIFTDTHSFYFSYTTDLTNSLQRLCHLEKTRHHLPSSNQTELWRNVDDRFFWNKHMMKELIELDNSTCDPWIIPIIQGYIQIEECKVDTSAEQEYYSKMAANEPPSSFYEVFTLAIVSRRSRHRAGTRYKRRGVDENGHCANYVETEQLVSFKSHEVSFVQVRGSVPVYWSQPGYKYRPPPKLEKDEDETKEAFASHFNKEIQKYGPICAINLIDQTGNEKVIFDKYTEHILLYDSPFLTYVTFDFHEYCRGMHFENVSVLMNAIADVIKKMNYCWRDKQGHICSQNGVFRINCIDCLDRTNVVQTAIGKMVMEMQFCKLGLIAPEGNMPDNIKSTFQVLWANNGDIISKQYAGTNALKGDYTRTGERKFTGIMKDGMNSANRFYLSHFKDSMRQCCLDLIHGEFVPESHLIDFWANVRTAGNIVNEMMPIIDQTHLHAFTPPHFVFDQEIALANLLYHTFRYYLSRFKDSNRQGTIDIMLGNHITEDLFNEAKANLFDEDILATAEHIKLLIEDCKKMLINEPEECVLGSWGLINADPSLGDPNEAEMDSIIILTKGSYFVADYDDQVDKITKYQQVLLQDITLIECGMPDMGRSFFNNSKSRYCIRINYKVDNNDGYYHMFRSANIGFFNNMPVYIKTPEEEVESLKAICEAFLVGIEICNLPMVSLIQGQKLDRRRSRIQNINESRQSGVYLNIMGFPQLTRNVSESQLLSLRNVGSKALSNMTQKFSKLNKISKSLTTTTTTTTKHDKRNKRKFTVGVENERGDADESTDSDSDYEHSIFQPNPTDDGTPAIQQLPTMDSSSEGSRISIEQGEEAIEDLLVFKSSKSEIQDDFLPGVGIVMGNKSDLMDETRTSLEEPIMMTSMLLEGKQSSSSSKVDSIQLSRIINELNRKQPEIQISSEFLETMDEKSMKNVKSIGLDKKLSHSSGEVADSNNATISNVDARFERRSNSDYEMSLNTMSQSISESALKNKLLHITSPVANVTKDLVFSPFSKLAKGVQHLGANLDPRKFNANKHTLSSSVGSESGSNSQKLKEKWQHSKTKLIAL